MVQGQSLFKTIRILTFKWTETSNLKDGPKVYTETMHDDGRKEISKATRVFLSEIKIKVKKRNGHVCAKNKIFRDRWFNVIFAEVFTVAFFNATLVRGSKTPFHFVFVSRRVIHWSLPDFYGIASITINWMLPWLVQDNMNNLLNIMGIERPSSAKMTSVKSRQDRPWSVVCSFTSNGYRNNDSVSEE